MDPTFGAPPPQQQPRPALPITRTPTTGNLRGIITCHRPTSCYIHWAGGKSKPCTAPDCALCRARIGRRWRVYISIYLPQSRRHLILELPERPGRQLMTVPPERPSLRHTIIAAYRIGRRANGPVNVLLEAGDPEKYTIPGPPDIEECLRTLWRLDQPEEDHPPADCSKIEHTPSELPGQRRLDFTPTTTQKTNSRPKPA